MIVKSIDHKWLAEVESETMGFNHLSPKDLLTHLQSVGGTLDHMDVTELFTNIQKPWDGIEAPAAHFARGDKFERQLLKAGQSKNPELRLAFALAAFQASGEFEPALRDWEAKSKVDQTFVNFSSESSTSRTKPRPNRWGTASLTASPTKKSTKSISLRHRPSSLPSWRTACKNKAKSNSRK
jgi:hypothetical protein